MRPFHHMPDAKPCRSGVTEIVSAPAGLDLANSPANAVRWIMASSSAWTTQAAKVDEAKANGLWPIPTIGDATYPSANQLVNNLVSFLNAVTDPNGLYIELINEPGDPNEGNPAINRLNYLTMLHTPCSSGANAGKTAIDVVHERGAKTSLGVMIAKSGAIGNICTDIDNGVGGSSWSSFNAISLHPYAQQPHDVINTLASQRGTIDSHSGAKGKPILVTEVGWSCATRAGGTGDNCTGQNNAACDWQTGYPNWLGVNQNISLAQQANRINAGDGTGLWERMVDRRDLRVMALCWFGHRDYTWSTYGHQNHYHHCGLFDFQGGERTSWQRLADQPDRLSTAFFHA